MGSIKSRNAPGPLNRQDFVEVPTSRRRTGSVRAEWADPRRRPGRTRPVRVTGEKTARKCGRRRERPANQFCVRIIIGIFTYDPIAEVFCFLTSLNTYKPSMSVCFIMLQLYAKKRLWRAK